MADKLDPDTAIICDACNGSGFSADHYCGKCGGAGGIPPEAVLADEITRLNAENERLKAYAREASIALSHLSGGGSEIFGKIGEEYYAEPKLAVERAEHKTATIERLVGARLNALVDEMREGLEPFAKAYDEIADGKAVWIERPINDDGSLMIQHFRQARALITKASRDSGHG